MSSALLLVGVLARILLVEYGGESLWVGLADRVEISTPVTGFKRMREGVFLWRNNIDPYEGGVFHQAPLLLALFYVVQERFIPYLFILADVIIARCLVDIAKYKAAAFAQQTWKKVPLTQGSEVATKKGMSQNIENEEDSTIPVDMPLYPDFIGVVHLLNPLSIATCLARSTLLFSSLAAVLGIWFALKGKRVYSMFSLSVATYLSLYPLMLITPCALLANEKKKSKTWSNLAGCLLVFVLFEAFLLGWSNLLMGSWNFVSATYGTIILVPDLTPNIGLSWYIFMEMFDQFRMFFLLVFQAFIACFIVPLSLKFSEHPLFLATAFMIITATFKSYPSIGDASLYIPFVFLHQELFKYMKNLYIIVHAGIYSAALLPLFYNLWIYAGSGNANFFYAITLAVGGAQVLLLGDLLGAMVRREWERGADGSLDGALLRRKRVEVALK